MGGLHKPNDKVWPDDKVRPDDTARREYVKRG